MLHIKRDPKTREVVYRFEHQGIVTHHPIPSQYVLVPRLLQTNVISFPNWLDMYREDATRIVDYLMGAIYEMHSEKYVIRVKNTLELHDKLMRWVYACSENKHKNWK